ncbi:MAG: Ig-like domain-containing protein [Deltaproteobacteria bacterium]|nr:Ig-like domain-containing protein [Deltaproteobacteria bacterium]
MRTGKAAALLILFLAVLAAGCGGGAGGGDGSATATVQIGLRSARQAAAAALPPAVTEVQLTISAPDIATITASLPLDGTVIEREVPAGVNRVFAAEALEGATVSYKGSTTVAELVAGSVVRVSITLDPVGADTTPPSVASTVPASEATDVAVNAAIAVTFSESVDEASLAANFIVEGPGGPVAGRITVSGSTATFTPSSPLDFSTAYTVTLGEGVKDLAGNPLAAPVSWSFTTGKAPDTTPPTMVSTVPANDAPSVPASTAVSITFSEPVDPATVTAATFTLSGPGGLVNGTVTVSGATATFTPGALVYGASYEATVTTAVRDLAGNPLAAPITWTFAIEPPPDTTPPAVISTAPPEGASDVPVGTAVSVTFSEAVEAASLASSFTLAGPGAQVAGTVTVTGATATLTPAASLGFGTAYTATVGTGARDLAGNALAAAVSWTFTTASAPDTTPPTVSSTTPANGANGVAVNAGVSVTFSEPVDAASLAASLTLAGPGGPVAGTVTVVGATATFTPAASLVPATAYTATVGTGARDLAGNPLAAPFSWTFTTGSAPDTTAPTVVSTAPTNGATGVPAGTAVAVSFSEAMNPATLTAATFTLTRAGVPVTGNVTYAPATLTATFTPAGPLAESTAYVATVTTGAQDAAGNALAANFTFGFTTADVTPPTVVSTIPADGTTNVALSTAVDVTFSELMDPATLTTATFTLTAAGAPVAGAVTYGAAFRTAIFTPAAPLTLGTAFVATVTTGAKDLAGNGLAAAVSFTFTTAVSDNIPPTVVSVSPPAPYTYGVSTRTSVTVTFSEPLDPATVTGSSFLVQNTYYTYDVTTVDIPGTVIYDPGTLTATFAPSYQLAFGRTYDVTLTAAVKDLAGNALATPFTSHFMTKPIATFGFSPPADPGGDLSVDTLFTATFDPEFLDSQAQSEAWIYLTSEAIRQYVPVTTGFDPNTRTWTVQPVPALRPNTSYSLSLLAQGPDGLGGLGVTGWTGAWSGWYSTANPPRTWGTEGPVSVSLAGDATLPRVAMDLAGNATAVWMESANGRVSVWGRRYDAATDTWGPTGTLETDDTVDMVQPRVAMDDNGNAVAIWNSFELPPTGPQPGTIYAAVYTITSGAWGWSEPFVLEHSDGTCLATGGVSMTAGLAVAVWSSCDSKVSAATFTGSYDVQRVELTSAAANTACGVGGSPDVATNFNGYAVTVWDARDPAGTPDPQRYLCASRFSNDVWEVPALVDQHPAPAAPDGQSLEPHLAVGRFSKDAVAAWRRWNPAASVYDIAAAVLDGNSGIWGERSIRNVDSNGSAATASVAAGGWRYSDSGLFVVTWRQQNLAGLSDVWQSQYSSGSQYWWSLPISTAGDARLPRAAVDWSGNLLAVFSQSAPPDVPRFDLQVSQGISGIPPTLVEHIDTGDARFADIAGNLEGDAVTVWRQAVGTKTFIYANVYRAPAAVPLPAPPVITADPQGVTVFEGSEGVFGVSAEGSRSFSYQWFRDGLELFGETAAFYVTPATTLADDGARFSVVVGNSADTATSADALLTVLVPAPPQILLPPADVNVVEGATATFSVAASGSPPLSYQWMRNDVPILGATGPSYTTPSTFFLDDGAVFSVIVSNDQGSATSAGALLTVTLGIQPAVSASRGFPVTPVPADIFYTALSSAGDVYTWGMNLFGGLGNGATGVTTFSPAKVDGLPAIHQVQAGGDHVLAVDTLGNVWAWGRNHLGQVGNDSGADVPEPVPIAGLSKIVRIGAGVDHSLAVDLDGNVFAWGNNAQGQLGLGTSGGTQPTPVQVSLPPGAPVIDVAGGLAHSLALRADGTVLAWGANDDGQLGDGTTTSSPSPVLVSGLFGARAIAAGWRHSMAAVPFGTENYVHINTWGANYYGQLGVGDTAQRNVPTPVPGTATLVFGGNETVLAEMLSLEGLEPRAWGLGDCGQLGNFTQGVCLVSNVVPPALRPSRMNNPQGPATSVSSGIRHSIVRDIAGEVWVSGLSPDGVTTVKEPIRVPGFTLN